MKTCILKPDKQKLYIGEYTYASCFRLRYSICQNSTFINEKKNSNNNKGLFLPDNVHKEISRQNKYDHSVAEEMFDFNNT